MILLSTVAAFLCIIILAVEFYIIYELHMLPKRMQKKPELSSRARIITRTLQNGAVEYARIDWELDGDVTRTAWFPTAEEAMQADYVEFSGESGK